MFRRKPPAPLLNPEIKHSPMDADDEFNPEEVRDTCFRILQQRMGPELAKLMRDDFDAHLENEGVEQAYVCLFGKMVNAIDRAMSVLTTGHLPDDDDDDEMTAVRAELADFDHFR